MYMFVKIPSLTTYAIYTDNTAVKAACCVQPSEIMSYRLWRHKFSLHFCAVIRLHSDKYLFAFLLNTHKNNDYSGRVHFIYRFLFQIINVRPYQFEPFSDNNKWIESFELELPGTLTRSEIEKTPNRLIKTGWQYVYIFIYIFWKH